MRAVIALVLAGCGRIGFAPESVDAAHGSDESFGAWTNPQPITVLDTVGNDADPTVTGDELEMYLSTDNASMGKTNVYVSKRATVTAAWSAPVLVTELSSPAFDDSPEVSPDGLTLWLSSTRVGDTALAYVATRPDRTAAWSTPVHVPELDGLHVMNLGFSGDGLDCITEHDDGTGNFDLYEYRRANVGDVWGAERHVTELATPHNESSQALDETGLVIFFTSDRPGTLGAYDIYTASRASVDDPFGEVTRVDAVDTDVDDGNPFLSRDGHTLYWATNRPPNVGARDIWCATRP